MYKKRRAQRPRPDSDNCVEALSNLLDSRRERLELAKRLLVQALYAKCDEPKGRLKRILKFKHQDRNLQARKPQHYCDTAEKAAKMGLGYLTSWESYN